MSGNTFSKRLDYTSNEKCCQFTKSWQNLGHMSKSREDRNNQKSSPNKLSQIQFLSMLVMDIKPGVMHGGRYGVRVMWQWGTCHCRISIGSFSGGNQSVRIDKVQLWYPTASLRNLSQTYLLVPSLWFEHYIF